MAETSEALLVNVARTDTTIGEVVDEARQGWPEETVFRGRGLRGQVRPWCQERPPVPARHDGDSGETQGPAQVRLECGQRVRVGEAELGGGDLCEPLCNHRHLDGTAETMATDKAGAADDGGSHVPPNARGGDRGSPTTRSTSAKVMDGVHFVPSGVKLSVFTDQSSCSLVVNRGHASTFRINIRR